MALKKTITRIAFGQSVAVPDAYIKVESVTGNKAIIHANVSFMTASDGQEIDSLRVGFEPSIDGGNFIKQAYEHLKTLPEFDGAVDC